MSIVRGIIVAWLIFLGLGTQVQAQLVVRLNQPTSPTRASQLELGYTALTTSGEQITASCLVRMPGQDSYTTFATSQLKVGGNSGVCNYPLTNQGEYFFQVRTVTASATTTSNTVSVVYQTNNPDRIENFSQSRADGCGYHIKFKTPGDNRVTKIEIYRSDKREFSTGEANKVHERAVTTNQEVEFTDTTAECGKDFYYAVRTLDGAGNASDLVGQAPSVASATVMVATPTPAATVAVSQNRPATPAVTPVPETITEPVEEPEPTSEPTTESGEVLGQTTQDVALPIVPTPEPLPADPSWRMWLLLVGGVVLAAGATTGLIVYLK